MNKVIHDEREWLVKLTFKGDKYGLNNCLTHDGIEPSIEFWDLSADQKKFGPTGQFVSRYNLTTFMDIRGHGLNLYGGVPVWQIDAMSVGQIQRWIKSECQWWKELPPELPAENAEAWPNMPPDLRQQLCWEHRT